MKYLIYIFLFFSLSTLSQVTKIDSLTLVLKNHTEKDTVRINTLNRLANKTFRNDKEKAIKLLNESLSISDSLNFTLGKIESKFILGKIYKVKLELDKADSTFHHSLEDFKKINNKFGIARVYKQLGLVQYYRGNVNKALSFYYKSLEANEKENANNLRAGCYLNIGVLQRKSNSIEKAIESYKKALSIYKDLDNKKMISVVLNNMGNVYTIKNQNNKAISVYKKSLITSKKLKNNEMVAYSYSNLGKLYIKEKKTKLGLSYYFKAVKILNEIQNYSELCSIYYEIANFYLSKNKTDLALKYIKKNDEILVLNKTYECQMMNNKLKSDFYITTKNYKKSLAYYKQYKINYDSIINVKSKSKITDLELKYKHKQKELQLKNNEIKLNKQIEETKQKLERSKRNILYGLLIILVLTVTLAFTVYKSRLKRLSSIYKRASLEQKLLRSQMKPHFIFNSLAVLQGIFLHQDYDKAHQYLSNFSRLLRIILETSRKEVITLETELQLIKDYINLRNISGNHPVCNYNIKIEDDINVHKTTIPPMIIQPIVENSFEHGFTDASKKYNLSIVFNIDKNYLLCTIIDDGEGISKTKSNNKKSISSTIIKEQLTFLSEKFNDLYDIKIIDRSKEGEKGTKVILKLPFKNSNND